MGWDDEEEDVKRDSQRPASPEPRRSVSRSQSVDREARRSPTPPPPESSRRPHARDREPAPPSKVIGVFNLDVSVGQSELEDVFKKYSPEKVNVVCDKDAQVSRGFAFITFQNVEDASRAKEEMHGTRIGGKEIRIDFSMTQRPHSPTPGRYMGHKQARDRRPSYRDRGYRRDDDRSRRGRSYSPRRCKLSVSF